MSIKRLFRILTFRPQVQPGDEVFLMDGNDRLRSSISSTVVVVNERSVDGSQLFRHEKRFDGSYICGAEFVSDEGKTWKFAK